MHCMQFTDHILTRVPSMSQVNMARSTLTLKNLQSWWYLLYCTQWTYIQYIRYDIFLKLKNDERPLLTDVEVWKSDELYVVDINTNLISGIFWLFGVKNFVFLLAVARFLSFQYHRGCWRDKAPHTTPYSQWVLYNPVHHTTLTPPPSLSPLWAKKRDRSYSWPLKNRYLSRHLRCTPQSIKKCG